MINCQKGDSSSYQCVYRPNPAEEAGGLVFYILTLGAMLALVLFIRTQVPPELLVSLMHDPIPGTEGMLLRGLMFLAVAIGLSPVLILGILTYKQLGRLINHWTLRGNLETLNVSCGPLPFIGRNHSLSTVSVESLDVESRYGTSGLNGRGSSRSFKLVAVLKTGVNLCLIQGISKEEEAKTLAEYVDWKA